MFTAKDLAEESTKIMIQGNEYSVHTQTRFDVSDSAVALSLTMNGTRTYDWNGKPNDSDNDQ